jgi:hypothetical protein
MDVLSSGRVAFRRAAGVTRAGVIVLALLAGVIVSVAATPGTAHAGAPPSRVVTYEVRGLDNGSDLEQFAAQAAETYADPRGWSLGGAVAFVRVPAGGSFTLWLAAPARLPGFGSPCSSQYSCTQGRNVIINEARWLSGSAAWNASGASLRDYRHMVVNHETGHWIGFGHQLCPGPGRPAPVMQQQSISLQGCAPNPWPLDSERQAAASRLGVTIRLGQPFGTLDAVQPWLRSVRVQGWAIDPDTAAPDVVQITVDAAPSFSLAALPRSDVAAAFPGYGPSHGFDAIIPASAGSHSVCVFAMNVAGGGGNVLLGCQTAVVGSPFGTVERVQSGPRNARVAGWVIDPDTPASTSVHVYVNGIAVAVPADRPRGDIGRAFPASGPNHGFDQIVAAPSGTHRVCLYGINKTGPGTNTTLECRTITVGGPPFGSVDAVRAGPGVIQVTGWVIDRDLATPGRVHAYVDRHPTLVPAARPRADVGQQFPLYGPNHGFDQLIPTTTGVHAVCLYGIDVSGPGDNTTLGCRIVTVGGSPFGSLDTVRTGPGVIQVTGWVIDRDTALPGSVHVYIDGVAIAVTADEARGDIGNGFPLYGARHGFNASFVAAAGAHQVCVYGINVIRPGANTTLGCRTVTVPA